MTTQGELDKAPLSVLNALIKGLSHPIKTLDWREFHFFKAQGLSKTDLVAIRICLDYELARESARVCSFVKKLSQERRQQMLQPHRLNSRCVSVRASGEKEKEGFTTWRDGDLKTFKEALDLPAIPAACVAASWFPKPWLCGEGSERRSIVKQLAPIYSTRPLAVFEFPLDNETSKLLRCSAQSEGSTLHVIVINRKQTRGAVRKAFDAWLDRQGDFSGSMSRQGKNKFTAELSDLGCYRLMTKLNSQARAHAMDLCGFKRSLPKLSEGKARAAKRLQELGYI